MEILYSDYILLFVHILIAEDIKKDFSEPKECSMLSTLCHVPLDVWSLGMVGTCIDAPAAFRFGKTEFNGFLSCLRYVYLNMIY